ncbi:transposase [Candidatus Bipolaricaulota bacterium]|nr:transposase [Candidatus Bipolaricaulota bacterium]
MAKNSYSPNFKFKVVLEALKGDRKNVEIARAYDIHPTTLSNWKSEFMDKGPEVFGDDETVQEYEKKISDLEQMLGKKEVEIALMRNIYQGFSS